MFVFSALAARFDSHGGPVLYATFSLSVRFWGFRRAGRAMASGVVAVAANTQVAIAYLAVLVPSLETR